MGSPVGAFDLFETVAPLGERHQRRLADFVSHVGDAIDVGQQLDALLFAKVINRLQETLGKVCGYVPVEICRQRDAILEQVLRRSCGETLRTKR